MDRLNQHPGQSGFHLLPENPDALTIRLLMAQEAGHTLDVQYYHMHNDRSGWLFFYYLMKAADKGVRVRILLDDIYTSGRGQMLGALDLHPDIEIRLFNPLATRGPLRTAELVLGTARVGRRMHNKAFIADNSVAVIGGRNIGDEYFSTRADHVYADLDVLTVGPVVEQISHSFDAYWNSEWAVPIQGVISACPDNDDYQNLRTFLIKQFANQPLSDRLVLKSELSRQWRQKSIPMEWATATVLYDLPQKIGTKYSDRSTHLSSEMTPILEQTQWEFLMISPYVIPSKDGMALFEKLRERGVKIRIITNSLASNDVPIVHSGYAPYRQRLLDMGVEIYEFKPTASLTRKQLRAWRKSGKAGLHAKAIILDRQKVFIGSTNLDPRSKILNTEITMMIESPELAGQVIDIFNEISAPTRSYQVKLGPGDGSLVWITEEDGREVRYQVEPKAGIWRRLGVTLAKPLPIENLL